MVASGALFVVVVEPFPHPTSSVVNIKAYADRVISIEITQIRAKLLPQSTLTRMAKSKTKQEPAGPKTIQNRKARFDYQILEEFEAGIVLAGSEVKSLYNGRANLTDAYCRVINDELWICNLDIEPYKYSNNFQPERRMDRKLLMHKREIVVIERKSLEKGFTILALEIYFKNGKAKVKIALGRGKALYDKRESIAKKDTRREMERARSEKF